MSPAASMPVAAGPPETRGRPAREVLAVAAAVVAFFGLLWLARGELGMTWDEPPDLDRQDAIRAWVARLFRPPFDGAGAFRREALDRGWPFTRAAPHEHPPVYALLGLATGELFGWLLGPLRAHRLATVFVFAVAAGVMVRLVRVRWGRSAALVALGALLFNPRLFADAQLVTLDAVVGGFWFLAAAAFLNGCETGRRPWPFGVLAGLTIMSKATGVLVFPALLLWTLVYRPRGAWRQFAWSVPIVPGVMIAVHPGWWTNPVAGVLRWAQALLHYQQKVPVYYLGKVYDSRTTFLPWHNTIVLTATMVPVGLLVLGGIGLAALCGRTITRRAQPTVPARLPDRAVAGWAAVQFLTLMVLRMFPFMPAHDGLRQLVPAFFFFPALAGYGAWALLQPSGPTRAGLARGLVLVCVVSASWETVRIHPYELAYYNVLIGGPRGAKAAGMETTYYWDAANDTVLAWMNLHLPNRSTVLIFPPPDVRTFAWLQRHGRLRRDLRMVNLDSSRQLALLGQPEPCFILFQMRQGLYVPRRSGDPPLFARLAESPALYELAPRRVDGVRLLAVFDQANFRAVIDKMARLGNLGGDSARFRLRRGGSRVKVGYSRGASGPTPSNRQARRAWRHRSTTRR